MKPDIRDIDSAHLAFVTGHKLTNVHRQYVSPLIGQVYFAKLDGVLQRLSDIRKRLEHEYCQAEKRQGTPYSEIH